MTPLPEHNNSPKLVPKMVTKYKIILYNQMFCFTTKCSALWPNTSILNYTNIILKSHYQDTELQKQISCKLKRYTRNKECNTIRNNPTQYNKP